MIYIFVLKLGFSVLFEVFKFILFFAGEIGPESDEEYQGPGRKRNRKGRSSRAGLGGSSRKTRKSRAKNVSMDDDYDQVDTNSHFCGLCGKVRDSSFNSTFFFYKFKERLKSYKIILNDKVQNRLTILVLVESRLF